MPIDLRNEKYKDSDNYQNTNGIYLKKKKDDDDKNYNNVGGIRLSKNLQRQLQEESNKKNNSFFKGSSAFDDGYDFGDITKTLFNTGTDILTDVGEGFMRTTEGIGDWLQYRSADVLDFFGNEDLSKSIRENADADATGMVFGKAEEGNLFGDNWTEGIERNSILGDTLDQVNQGIGNIAAMAGGSYLTGGNAISTAASSYTSAYGNARSEAKRNGASDSDANKAGVISGISEAISEQIFNGIPGLKTAGWGDKLAGKLSGSVAKQFGKKSGRIFLSLLKAAGEGSEEIISNLLNTTGTYIADRLGGYEYGMQQKSGNYIDDIVNDLTSKESWDAFLSASLSSMLVDGGNTAITNIQKNNAIKNYAKENNVSIEQATKDFNKIVNITTNENLPTEANFKDKIELEGKITKDLAKATKNGLNLNTEAQLIKTNEENKKIGFELTQEEQKIYENDEIAKNIYDKAMQKGANNSKEAHKIINDGIKIAKDINLNLDFTNNQDLAEQLIRNKEKELNRKLNSKEISELEEKASKINGMKVGDNILLNLESNLSKKFVLGHEMKHFFEQNKQFNDELNEKLVEWAKNKGIHDQKMQETSEIYANIENANILDEVTADYIGELFSSEDSMKSFAKEDYTTFEKIANYFKKLYYKVTNQKEKLLVQEINERIQKVYSEVSKERQNLKIDRESEVNINGDEKYALAKYTSMKNQTEIQDKRVITAYKLQKKGYSKDYIWLKTGVELLGKEDAILYEKDLTMKKDFDPKNISDFDGKVSDVFEGELLNNFPQLGEANFRIYDISKEYEELYGTKNKKILKMLDQTAGSESLENGISLNKKFIDNNINNKEINKLIENLLSHEFQHYIQDIQYGDKGGTSYFGLDLENDMMYVINENGETNFKKALKQGQKDYLNNPLEIEAEVNRFLNEMTSEERKLFPLDFIYEKISESYNNNENIENARKKINEWKSKYENSLKMWYNDASEGEAGNYYENYTYENKRNIDRIRGIKVWDRNNNVHVIYENGETATRNIGYFESQEERNEKANNKRNSENDKRNELELEDSSFNLPKYSLSEDNDLKQKQLDIILNNNPAEDELHTWIRKVDDIKTLKETLEDSDWSDYDEFNPDLTRQDIEDAIESGKITVYSSYPIEQGIFVSPSRMEAESYSGDGKVYSKEVNINDIAWIDPTQGQYASVNIRSNDNTKYSISDNKGRKLSQQQQEYFKDSKVRDENGNLLTMYHGTPTGDFSVFKPGSYFSSNEEYATGYQNESASSISYGKKTTTPKTYEVYLNIKNPFTLTNKTAKDIYIKEYIKGGNSAYFDPYTDYTSTINNMDEIDWVEGEDLKEWLQENHPEFDGLYLDEGGDGGYGMAEYRWRGLSVVPFNSNQIKNVDNLNPTINEDIRYSYGKTNLLPSSNDERYSNLMVQNNDINIPINEESNFPIADVNTQNILEQTQQRANKRVKDKVQKAIDRQSYKAVNIATKTGQSYLDFDRNQKKEFKESLSKFIGKTREQLVNVKTMNDIKNIVRNYADKEIKYVDEELQSVKSQIRNTKIKVSDELKNQITDYGYFRKSNFGKLQLGKNGQNIDTVYEELSEMYPYYFSKDITSEADMLYTLSEFMNQDTTTIQKYSLDEATIENAAIKVYNKLVDNTMNKEYVKELQEQLEAKATARTREVVQQELLDEMGITVEDIMNGNDISAPAISRTDPIRLNEKIFGYETGQKINDATVNKVKSNEAQRIRFLNKERHEIEDLGIKARSKESAAVQKYGEKQYINDLGELVEYGDKELANEFPDIETQNKIKNAAKVIRQKYDNYIDSINNVLVDMGYNPIKKRNDYMRHFQTLNDVFSRLGVPLNPENLSSDSLPTDINGLTDQFKPGKQFFSSELQRLGQNTTYDAITGIDGYLEGASNLIYHTENIQRYRTLSKLIRDNFGKTHGFEDFANMTQEQQEQRINDIQSNKLSKYAAWLDEQANALAGKKGKIDRGVEEFFGRKVYGVLDAAKKQVGSNMTGFNVRSALTNFASAVQGASKTNKLAFIKGTLSTIKNIVSRDNLINKSDFLTNRFGSDSLSKKLWQKASNAGQIFMTGSDWFTANQIWRSKYFENLSKGMNETEAIKEADDFASRIMGDRSKGSTATLFNSKTLGFFTQFQLEVNNQWSSLIHDNKIDIQKGNKTAAGVVFQLGELAAFSYFFNNFMKSLTGSDVMIDPIDLFKKLLGDGEDDDKSLEERAEDALGDIVDDLPFISFMNGGRIPVAEAFNGIGTGIKKITGQKDEYGNNIEWSDVGKDIIESSYYWLLPTGYGQIKKTKQGLSMYDENLPIAGSYTDSGNLRFEADTSIGGQIRSALFGQWSSKEAQEYLDKGYTSLREKDINTIKESGLSVSKYRKYKEKIKNKELNEEKIDYIYNLPLKTEQKNILANNVLNRKGNIDLSNYGEYDSLEEFDYANKNPEKYSIITQITDFKSFNSYKEEISKIKEKYNNTNSKKQAVFKYINSLDLNKYQKLMLQKEAAGYSVSQYKNELRQYINGLNLSKQEKQEIDKELFD